MCGCRVHVVVFECFCDDVGICVFVYVCVNVLTVCVSVGGVICGVCVWGWVVR